MNIFDGLFTKDVIIGGIFGLILYGTTFAILIKLMIICQNLFKAGDRKTGLKYLALILAIIGSIFTYTVIDGLKTSEWQKDLHNPMHNQVRYQKQNTADDIMGNLRKSAVSQSKEFNSIGSFNLDGPYN